MTGRKKAFFAMLALAFLLLCGASHAADARALRISCWKLPFNLPVMWERAHGGYATAFADMKVTEIDLQSGPKQMAAVAAGDLDVVQGIGDAAFLVSVAGGIDAKIIAVNSRSPKAFAVMTNNPSIRTIADLKGKKVAGLRGSVVHQVLVSALAEHGLKESDLEFFPMPIPQAAATLLAKRADAALLVGSEIVRVRKAGGRILADGEGRVKGLSLVVAGTKFLQDNPGFPDRFRKARQTTLVQVKADKKAAAALAAKETGMSEKDALDMMVWYDFGETLTDADVESLKSTMKYLLEQNMAARALDPASLVWKEDSRK